MKRILLPLLSVFLLCIGVNIKTSAQCTLSIIESQGLWANASGADSNSVFTYIWSTGDTGSVLLNPIPGQTYCVTAFDNIDSCSATACYTYQDSTGGGGNCSVVIIETNQGLEAVVSSVDSTNYVYYQWDNGSTDAENTNPLQGQNCVTIWVVSNNFDTCYATACYTYQDSTGGGNCSVFIVETSQGLEAVVSSVDSTNYVYYQWDNGSTDAENTNPLQGQNCVTIWVVSNNFDTCYATACYTYQDSTGGGGNCSVMIIEGPNGQLEAVAYGADSNAIFTYTWSNGDTGNFIYNPVPGQTYCVTAFDNTDSCSATACYTYQDSASAVQEFNAIQAINIYPNPAHSQLFIELNTNKSAAAQIMIHDVLGQVLVVKNIHSSMGQNIISLDVLNMQTGIYFVTYTQNQETKMMRFLKQ